MPPPRPMFGVPSPTICADKPSLGDRVMDAYYTALLSGLRIVWAASIIWLVTKFVKWVWYAQ